MLAHRVRAAAGHARRYATQAKAPSAHAQLYADMLPAMAPVALLGSAVYLGLHLLRGSLDQEKHLAEAGARVRALEQEITVLRAAQAEPAVASAHTSDPAPTPKRGWFP